MPKDISQPRTRVPHLRKPTAEDGAAIWELVRQCKPLDENSMYCNLIQADHFADTCVVAEVDDQILGWVSGYIVPNEDTFFVWQVAVSPQARGMGLGKKMLNHLVNRDSCDDVDELRTTITKDNEASWALFRSFADHVNGDLDHEPHFIRDDHFDGQHATEHMVTIRLPEAAALKRAA